jgi:hypothetical protein
LFDRPKPTAGCSANGEEEKKKIGYVGVSYKDAAYGRFV